MLFMLYSCCASGPLLTAHASRGWPSPGHFSTQIHTLTFQGRSAGTPAAVLRGPSHGCACEAAAAARRHCCPLLLLLPRRQHQLCSTCASVPHEHPPQQRHCCHSCPPQAPHQQQEQQQHGRLRLLQLQLCWKQRPWLHLSQRLRGSRVTLPAARAAGAAWCHAGPYNLIP